MISGIFESAPNRAVSTSGSDETPQNNGAFEALLGGKGGSDKKANPLDSANLTEKRAKDAAKADNVDDSNATGDDPADLDTEIAAKGEVEAEIVVEGRNLTPQETQGSGKKGALSVQDTGDANAPYQWQTEQVIGHKDVVAEASSDPKELQIPNAESSHPDADASSVVADTDVQPSEIVDAAVKPTKERAVNAVTEVEDPKAVSGATLQSHPSAKADVGRAETQAVAAQPIIEAQKLDAPTSTEKRAVSTIEVEADLTERGRDKNLVATTKAAPMGAEKSIIAGDATTASVRPIAMEGDPRSGTEFADEAERTLPLKEASARLADQSGATEAPKASEKQPQVTADIQKLLSSTRKGPTQNSFLQVEKTDGEIFRSSEAAADTFRPQTTALPGSFDKLVPASPPKSPLVANVINQIKAVKVDQGTTKVQLRPHGLGLIEVEMKTDKDGLVEVALRAKNPMVLEALRAERGAISDLLSQQGVQVKADGLNLDQFGQANSHKDKGRGDDGPGSAGVRDDPEGASEGSTEDAVAQNRNNRTSDTNILI